MAGGQAKILPALSEPGTVLSVSGALDFLCLTFLGLLFLSSTPDSEQAENSRTLEKMQGKLLRICTLKIRPQEENKRCLLGSGPNGTFRTRLKKPFSSLWHNLFLNS